MGNSFGVRSVSPYRAVTELTKKSGDRCGICGMHVNARGYRHKEWNIDHVIPKAVLKWGICPDGKFEYYRSLLSDPSNQIISHPGCNCIKGCNPPTPQDIDNLHISDFAKCELKSTLKELSPLIESYNARVLALLMKQDSKCSQCGCELDENMAIRRIDNTRPRTTDNAMLLCAVCNALFMRNNSRVPNVVAVNALKRAYSTEDSNE